MKSLPPAPPAEPPANESQTLALVRTVLWGFFGVRRNAEYLRDIERHRPLPLIVAGLLMTALLVLLLLSLAHWMAGAALAS